MITALPAIHGFQRRFGAVFIARDAGAADEKPGAGENKCGPEARECGLDEKFSKAAVIGCRPAEKFSGAELVGCGLDEKLSNVAPEKCGAGVLKASAAEKKCGGAARRRQPWPGGIESRRNRTTFAAGHRILIGWFVRWRGTRRLERVKSRVNNGASRATQIIAIVCIDLVRVIELASAGRWKCTGHRAFETLCDAARRAGRFPAT